MKYLRNGIFKVSEIEEALDKRLLIKQNNFFIAVLF